MQLGWIVKKKKKKLWNISTFEGGLGSHQLSLRSVLAPITISERGREGKRDRECVMTGQGFSVLYEQA